MLPRLSIALTTLISLATVVVGIPTDVNKPKCGPEELCKRGEASAPFHTENGTNVDLTSRGSRWSARSIPVAFNVVSDGPKTGVVTQKQIDDQIAVVNKAFAPVNLQLAPVRVNYMDQPHWFHDVAPPNSPVLGEMIRSAIDGAGRPDFLNIFTVGFTHNSSVLSWAGFPWNLAEHMDAVVFNYRTLPGGKFKGHNLGMTLVEAVATWLGVVHPYRGGCDGPGDGLLDTPPQAGPVEGCPVGLKSCPGDHPDDLVWNYMSGAYDSCKHSFTDDQISQMRKVGGPQRGIPE